MSELDRLKVRVTELTEGLERIQESLLEGDDTIFMEGGVFAPTMHDFIEELLDTNENQLELPITNDTDTNRFNYFTLEGDEIIAGREYQTRNLKTIVIVKTEYNHCYDNYPVLGKFKDNSNYFAFMKNGSIQKGKECEWDIMRKL